MYSIAAHLLTAERRVPCPRSPTRQAVHPQFRTSSHADGLAADGLPAHRRLEGKEAERGSPLRHVAGTPLLRPKRLYVCHLCAIQKGSDPLEDVERETAVDAALESANSVHTEK
jgi:hypothetical protein